VKQCSSWRQLGAIGWPSIPWLSTWQRGLLAVRRCVYGCLLSVLLLFLALPEASAASTVRDITLLPHNDGVRVVIDLGNKVPFQHRTFDHPPRLIIELPDVSWQIPERRAGRTYRMVKGFQFGRLRNNVSSLIIDMDRAFEIETVFRCSNCRRATAAATGSSRTSNLCPAMSPCAASASSRRPMKLRQQRQRPPIARSGARLWKPRANGREPAATVLLKAGQGSLPLDQRRRRGHRY